jgi:hypothetical protein
MSNESAELSHAITGEFILRTWEKTDAASDAQEQHV